MAGAGLPFRLVLFCGRILREVSCSGRNRSAALCRSDSLVAMPSLPDYLQPGLRLVFVGFNPSMRSAAVGHYYAGPGNLFWPLLYETGLLPEPLTYAEDHRILDFGIGLTDLVKRPTRSSADLLPAEARAGVFQLQTKLVTYAPRVA